MSCFPSQQVSESIKKRCFSPACTMGSLKKGHHLILKDSWQQDLLDSSLKWEMAILFPCLFHIENLLVFPHSGMQFPMCCWVLWCYKCDQTLSSFRMTVKCAFLRLKGEGKAWCRDRKLMSLVIADSAMHYLRENRRWAKNALQEIGRSPGKSLLNILRAKGKTYTKNFELLHSRLASRIICE